MNATVAFAPPPGFVPSVVSEPPLSGGSGGKVTQWVASRSLTTHDVLLVGCVATPIPGWVEDMRPAVESRTISLTSASAERIVGVQIESREDHSAPNEPHLSLRPVGAPEDAARVGIARTFVGWDDGNVMTCFATCAAPVTARPPPGPRACDGSVLGARLDERATHPPPAGFVLGGITWAVHHPSDTLAWAGGLALVLGVVAIASRRRPRSRI